MDVFTNNHLKRLHFLTPPPLCVWRARPSGLVLLDPGDPAPSVWPARVGRYWIFPNGKRVSVFAGASEMSDYLEGQVRAHIFRTATFAKPAALGVGLWGAAAPTLVDASTGATAGESTVGGYARVSRAPLDANWTAASATDGLTDNAAALTFPTASANWNNQPCQDVGICDATGVGAGNLLLYSPLAVAKTINSGDTAEFGIGALDVTFA